MLLQSVLARAVPKPLRIEKYSGITELRFRGGQGEIFDDADDLSRFRRMPK